MAAKKKTSKKTAKKKTTKKKVPSRMKKGAKKKVAPKKVSGKKNTTKKKLVKKKTSTKKKLVKKKTSKKTTAKKQTVKNKATRKITKRMTKVTKINTKSKITGKTAKRTKVVPYKERRGEEYMGVEQTEYFRILLSSWKGDLMKGVDRTVHHMQDEAANFPDPNDRATQEEEFSLELRTRDRERKLIKKIDEAIIALDSGDYGYCEVCGIEIGKRRLEARPTATLCIDCKTLDEIKERQLG